MRDKLREHVLGFGVSKSWADAILWLVRQDVKKRLKTTPNNFYVCSGEVAKKMADYHVVKILQLFYKEDV